MMVQLRFSFFCDVVSCHCVYGTWSSETKQGIKTLVINQSVMQHHIPEEQRPQQDK